MIINISRASTFQECRQKAMYYSKHRLSPYKIADPLLLGGAYHKGLAEFFASGDMAQAVFKAEAEYRKAYEEQTEFILPEEKPLIERNTVWLNNSLVEFAKHYKSGDIQVLQPEVEFCVPVPNTYHFCKFLYLAEHPEAIGFSIGDWMQLDISRDEFKRYWHPHYLRGKTDAVVKLQNQIWLFEHKTEARTGDTYFIKYLLDFQPTAYIWGIREAIGLRPAGFILNIIKKPNSNFKGDPLQVVGFEREAYVRSDADLDRFAHQLGSLADDFEEAFFNANKTYLNTKSCTNWNRKCEFHAICSNHDELDPSKYVGSEFQLRQRLDYVEEEYFKILGLPLPSPETLYQIHPAPKV